MPLLLLDLVTSELYSYFFFISHLEDKVVFEGPIMIGTKREIRELVREFVREVKGQVAFMWEIS